MLAMMSFASAMTCPFCPKSPCCSKLVQILRQGETAARLGAAPGGGHGRPWPCRRRNCRRSSPNGSPGAAERLEAARDIDALLDQDMLGDDLEDWLAESSLMRRTFRNVAIIAGHVLLRAARADAASGLIDIRRLADMLAWARPRVAAGRAGAAGDRPRGGRWRGARPSARRGDGGTAARGGNRRRAGGGKHGFLIVAAAATIADSI